jgi:general secretion pathway protein B
MSYILDALKKSERERPPGTAPDLFTVHGPQPQPPSPRWPTRAIIAVALLLAVPAIGLLAWIGTDRRDESAVRPTVAASPQPRAEDPTGPTPPRTVAAPAPAAPARIVAAARRPPGERPQPPALPRQRSRGSVVPSVVPTPGPAATPTSAAPAPASVTAVPVSLTPAPDMSAPSDMPPPPEAGREAPTAPVPAVSEPEEAPPADGRVLDLAGLPATISAELPKLLVTGHVWSEEPSMRLLSVDDRLLREGGEAAPGVSLQEITPEGAVFVFKGWRFRVAGRRP